MMNDNSLKDCFLNVFSAGGEKTAISFFRDGVVETEVTYRDLDHDSNRIVTTFRDLGVNKGDRVILFLQKSLIFVIAHLALQKIGAVTIPLNPGFKKSEMAYLIHDSEAKLVLTGSEQKALINDIDPYLTTWVIHTETPYQDLDFFRSASESIVREKVEPHDPGLIIYTSGTTGKPKGAILTQRNLVHDARNIIKIWEISMSDVLCHALPLFHVHGLCFALHTALIAGSHVLMLDQFSPQNVIEILKKKEGEPVCTVFMAVPPMYGKLMDYVGEKVVAAIVPRAGSKIKAGDIQAYCRQHLHNWKSPKEIVFLKGLPKNTMGKVLNEKVKNFFRP